MDQFSTCHPRGTSESQDDHKWGAHMYVYAHVYTSVGVQVHIHGVDVGCLPQSLSTTSLLELGPLTEPQLADCARRKVEEAPGTSCLCLSGAGPAELISAPASFVNMVPGDLNSDPKPPH